MKMTLKWSRPYFPENTVVSQYFALLYFCIFIVNIVRWSPYCWSLSLPMFYFFFQLHYSLYLRIKVVPIWYLSQNSNPMLCRNCFSSFCPNYRGCNTWPELCDKNWSICSYPVQHSLFSIQVLY